MLNMCKHFKHMLKFFLCHMLMKITLLHLASMCWVVIGSTIKRPAVGA